MDVLYSNTESKRGNDCRIYHSVQVFKDPLDHSLRYRFRRKVSGWRPTDRCTESGDIESILDNRDVPDEWKEEIKDLSEVTV